MHLQQRGGSDETGSNEARETSSSTRHATSVWSWSTGRGLHLAVRDLRLEDVSQKADCDRAED